MLLARNFLKFTVKAKSYKTFFFVVDGPAKYIKVFVVSLKFLTKRMFFFIADGPAKYIRVFVVS